MIDLNDLARRALETCRRQGWKRTWLHSGCYLHLEVSEFIEALRGKGDSTPGEEAADVLFVLLSTLEEHGISSSEVFRTLDQRVSTEKKEPL